MKNGFTLIELLAVIVILAIIALIATPIVLNIINDTKESATLRSAEFYLDAVDQAIVRAQLTGKTIVSDTYNITEDGNICLEYNEDNTCKETLKVEVKGETPSSGSIYINGGNIDEASVILNETTVVKNENGEIIPIEDYKVCSLDSDTGESGITPGDKYICKVKPGTKYTFFVLSNNEDGTTNLIMDSNINSKGEAIKSNDIEDKGSVEWITYSDYEKNGGTEYGWEDMDDKNSYGPITAMDYLEKATSSWTNLTKMIITKFGEYSWINYGNIKKTYNVYVRLPNKGELEEAGCNEDYPGQNQNRCPLWLVNYLNTDSYYTESTEKVNINEIDGYWTSDINATSSAFRVVCSGYFGINFVHSSSGVRPVITVKL